MSAGQKRIILNGSGPQFTVTVKAIDCAEVELLAVTVTMYFPEGVPVVGPLGDLLPPPQLTSERPARSNTKQVRTSRRDFIEKTRVPTTPNAKNCSSPRIRRIADIVRGPVVTVAVIETGPLPFSIVDGGVTTHDPEGGAPEHEKETVSFSPVGLITLKEKVAV
jgi:hypothetical protein